jgi:hypothetical protein
MTNRAFNTKRGEGGDGSAPTRTLCESHVLLTRRTDGRAL